MQTNMILFLKIIFFQCAHCTVMNWQCLLLLLFLDALASLAFKLSVSKKWLFQIFSLYSLYSLFSLHSLHSLYSQNNILVTLINRGGYEGKISHNFFCELLSHKKNCEIFLVDCLFSLYGLQSPESIQSIHCIQSIQVNLAHLRVDFRAFFGLI